MRATDKIASSGAPPTNKPSDSITRSSQRRQLIIMSSSLGASLFIGGLLQFTTRPRLTGAQANPGDTLVSVNTSQATSADPTEDSLVVPGNTSATQTSSTSISTNDSTVDVNISNASAQPGSQSSTTVNINGQELPVSGSGSIHKTVKSTTGSSTLSISVNSQTSNQSEGDGM